MTLHSEKQPPLLTFAFAGAFLLLNAQLMQGAAWAVAFSYVMWQLFTRLEGPGLPQELGRILVFPFLLLFTGLHGFFGNSLEDYGKDCWYFLAPILYIAFGYLVAERIANVKRIVYLLSVVGVLVSLQSLWHIFQQANLLLKAASAEDYHQLVGTGAGQSMIPVVLIVMCRQAKIDLGLFDRFPWLRYLVISLGSVSIVLALSRTLLSILLIGVVLGGARKFLVLAVIAGGVAMVLPQTSAILDSGASQSFFEKITRVGDEVQLHPYSSMAEINDNWRGFEGYKAMETYHDLTPFEQVFGGGFGQLVNLGFMMNLGGPTEIQEIPILHNGYLYLLVKTGVVGVALFFFFNAQLLLRGRRMLQNATGEARLCGCLFVWCSLTFLLTQGVITGIYNKGVLAPNLIVLGMATALYRCKQRVGRRMMVDRGAVFHPFRGGFSGSAPALLTEVYEPS